MEGTQVDGTGKSKKAGRPPRKKESRPGIQYLAFWPDDFFTNLQLHPETTEATGAWARLCFTAARLSRPGYLPNDDTLLAQWSGLDPEGWQRVKKSVLEHWKYDKKQDRYVIRRIRAQLAMLNHRSETASRAADQRWRDGKLSDSSILDAGALHPQSGCSAGAMPSTPLLSTHTPLRGGGRESARSTSRSRGSPSLAGPPATSLSPPAVSVLGEVTKLVPIPALWDRISGTVGDDTVRVARWREFVVWWCGEGFNPGNVNGMLDRWRTEHGEGRGQNGGAPTGGHERPGPVDPDGARKVEGILANVGATLGSPRRQP